MAESKPRYGIWPAYGLALLILFGLVFSLTSSLTPFGSATSPDSISYLDIASHIKSGDGWRTTDVALDAVGHPGAVQNRAWPPLYPFLLSAFVRGSADVTGAACLSGILFGLTVLLVFLLVVRRSNCLIALGVAISTSLAIPVLTIFTFAWSEAVFVPVMLLATLCAAEYLAVRDGSRLKRVVWLIGLVLALVLLPYARYIGIVLALLLPVTFALSRRDAWDRALFCVSLPFYSIPVGYLLWGNFQASGALSGVPRQPSDMGLGGNLQNMAEAFLVALPHSPLALLLSGAVAIVAGIFAKQALAVCERASDQRAPVGVLAAFGSIVYLLALILMRTHTNFDLIDIRLIAPSLPLLLIAIFFGVLRLAQKSKHASLAVMLGAFLLAVFAAAGYEQYRTSAQQWLVHADPELPMRGGVSYRNFTQPSVQKSTQEVFSRLVAQGGVIVAHRALIWRFVSGVKTVELPPARDIDGANKLRRLPAGSVLLLERFELDSYLRRLMPGRDYSAVTDLGGLVLVRLTSGEARTEQKRVQMKIF